MPRFRRIMYTSSGSAEPSVASRTSTTDAAGFGSTGVGLDSLIAAPTEERGVAAGSRTPLQINQLRDPLAVVRRVAEGELGRLGALEVEVQVVLPGEPDAAVELDAGAGHLTVGVGDVRLGHRSSQRGLRGVLVDRPGGVVRERLR